MKCGRRERSVFQGVSMQAGAGDFLIKEGSFFASVANPMEQTICFESKRIERVNDELIRFLLWKNGQFC